MKVIKIMNAPKKFTLIFLALTLCAQPTLHANSSSSYSWWKIGAAVAGVAAVVGGYCAWKWWQNKQVQSQLDKIRSEERQLAEKNRLRDDEISKNCATLRFANFVKKNLSRNPAALNWLITDDVATKKEDAIKNISRLIDGSFNNNKLRFVDFPVGLDQNTGEGLRVLIPLFTAAVCSGEPTVVKRMIDAHADVNTPPLGLMAYVQLRYPHIRYNLAEITLSTDQIATDPQINEIFEKTNHNLLLCLGAQAEAALLKNTTMLNKQNDIINMLRAAGARDPLGLANQPVPQLGRE